MPVLTDRKPRPWKIPVGGKGAFTAAGYHLGRGGTPLEVAVATSPVRPTESDVRNLWKRRKGNQPSPLLLVVLWPSPTGERATVCGVTGDNPAVHSDRNPDQMGRLASLALGEPDHHAATRSLAEYLPEETGGLRNVSLFATHHLVGRVQRRPDWSDLCKQGELLIGLRREQLVQALGFSLEAKGRATILRAAGHARALAVFLDDTDNPDAAATRFNGMTPVSWAIAAAAADNIPYVVLTRGPQIRIYTTRAGAGAAGKGGTSAFIEINLPLLTADDAGYLPLLCAADSLAEHGHFEELLEESQNFAADLGDRLRTRVYDQAVPHIASALIARHAAAGGATDHEALSGLYERALLVLFRLLFVAYSEDRDLLPLRTNGLYRQRSLKHTARELAGLANQYGWASVPFDEHATDLWDNVRALWGAIDNKRAEWNVPRYNGGMFSSDPEVNPEGAALASIELTNAEFGPALQGLLVDKGDDQWGAIDFASLDVREFGTIYEGLLESDLAMAPCDLTLDEEGMWLPAGRSDIVEKKKGEVYLHNKSGARKSSGSYFTKPVAVNHLLDHALEPALDLHVQRVLVLLASGDEIAAARVFFDFRCVDLSMGSGHFLVAAVDRIERRLSKLLAEHRIGGVLDELARLAESASQNLAEVGVEEFSGDTSTLLRRQVARRCIYGVDLNPTSVELARLALWIHTFVKGLPLTTLNHGLIVGNSLTGIGTLDEAFDVLDPDRDPHTPSFIRLAILEALEQARESLEKFASTSEATASEVRQARKAHSEAQKAVAPAKDLLDLAVAIRIGEATVPIAFDTDALLAAARISGASELARELGAIHFPVAFPEVFGRTRPGFDCVLGNPPYDKVRHEPTQFWVTRFPGLNNQSAAAQKETIHRLREERPTDAAIEERDMEFRKRLQALATHSFSWQGHGQHSHFDLSKLFVERAIKLTSASGSIGYVLPRVALVVAGWTELRGQILASKGVGILQAHNRGGWLFDDVHQQNKFLLLTVNKGESDEVLIWPAIGSPAEVQAACTDSAIIMTVPEIEMLTDKAVVPWFSARSDVSTFTKLRAWEARLGSGTGWVTGTADSSRWDFSGSGPHRVFLGLDTPGAWQVLMSRHVDQYRIAVEEPFTRHITHPELLADLHKGIEVIDGRPLISASHPTVVFRYASTHDNSRTLIATALPEAGYLYSKGYVSGVRTPADTDPVSQLALLGLLNSWICDWWVRRFVDRHVTKQIIENIPLPEWDHATRARVAGIAAFLLEEVSVLPGGWTLPLRSAFPSRTAALVEIEMLVMEGFRLSSEDLTTVLCDFSDSGCPPDVRSILTGRANQS